MTTETTAAQVAMKHLLPLLPQDTITVFDRSYNSTWFWCQCSALPHKGTLIRLKSNRGLYRPAPPPTGRRGSPRKDGDKLRPDAPVTHGNPAGQWEGTDQQERPVRLMWWKHLYLEEALSGSDSHPGCAFVCKQYQARSAGELVRLDW